MSSRTLKRISGSSQGPQSPDEGVRWRGQSRRELVVHVGGVVTRSLSQAVIALAFWVAVAVPFLALALLVGGLETRSEFAAFLTLVALNLVALGVGHRYRHPNSE